MKVFTFYSPVEGKREVEEASLIELWKKSWSVMGWEPVVLGYKDIVFDDEVGALVKEFKKLPSINKHNLDYWCYLRWVAVCQQGGGFMSDYDVINYTFAPREADGLTTYDGYVPCLVSGTKEEFSRAIRWFADDRRGFLRQLFSPMHTSDMLILKKRMPEFTQAQDCVEYGAPGWEVAPVVHYCNKVMKPTALMPRHEHVEGLRPLVERSATA